MAAFGSPFLDIPRDFWASDEIGAYSFAEIVGGYLDGFCHPEYACTGDQMAMHVAGARGPAM